MEDIEDLSKMKVADLKKHLKSKGLSVAGNKTELVERLQQALQSELTDDNPTLDAGAVDDDEFDEEEILGGDDDDMDKITQEEEAAALAGNIRVKGDSLLLDKSKPEKKKISLKRSQPSLSSASEVETPEVAETTEESVPSTVDESTNDKENSITTSSEESKHKKIKLSETSEENALELRAKKFGSTTNTDTDEGRRLARATRFGVEAPSTVSSSTNSSNRKVPKLSMEVGSTDLDKLKKRAERFGEVTSKSLSKLEELEKKKVRQNRFLESNATSDKSEEKKSDAEKTDEDKKEKDVSSEEVKSARAERFGAGKENGTPTTTASTKVAITAPSSEMDAKQKRAQRFA